MRVMRSLVEVRDLIEQGNDRRDSVALFRNQPQIAQGAQRLVEILDLRIDSDVTHDRKSSRVSPLTGRFSQ